MHRITVVGGGFAGLTAAVSAAEAGAKVTLYEAHHTLGGRARTADAPYRTNEGPHALYNGGPHWTWLRERGLLGPLAPLPLREAARLRLRHRGALRRTPPPAMLKLLRPACGRPSTPTSAPGPPASPAWTAPGPPRTSRPSRCSTTTPAPCPPRSCTRLRRATKLPPEAHYPRGGWGTLIDRMAAHAWNLGVRVETLSRVDTLPTGAPVVVATSLEAARRLLGDPSLTWPSGRTVLVDLALRTRRGDPFVVSDLDAPGWLERFTAQDRTLAPAGEELIQGQIPVGPGASKAEGAAHADELLDLGFPGWRERLTWRREALADGRTGAVDPPGATWRDRPAVDRGDGVYLAGDRVAAPGVLSEVSFTSALTAVSLALGRDALDLKRA